MKQAYMVMALFEIAEIQVQGYPRLPVSMYWAKGMLGVFPVFADKQSALNYAAGEESLVVIVELEDRQVH